jgi:hypothetical protein
MKKKTGRGRVELWAVSEGEVARRLGITQELVREWRVEWLYEHEDWGLVGREIKYTEGGIEKLRGILKKTLPAGAMAGDLGRKLLTARAASLEGWKGDVGAIVPAVTVTRVMANNPQYMDGKIDGKEGIVLVRVRDNKNFLAGMVIPPEMLERRHDRLFNFVGRYPKSRGRW